MASPIDEIRRQILDENKRAWGLDDCGGDPDVFYTQVVVPLRTLRARGMIESLALKVNDRGESDIGVIEIIGAINLDARSTRLGQPSSSEAAGD